MRPSTLDQIKQEDVKKSLVKRLASLDYDFWISWQGLLLLVAFPVVALLGWGSIILHSNPSEPWGTFGDAFAPITSFFTALALEAAVITLLLQRKEISEQNELFTLQKQELRLLQESQRTKIEQTKITEEANKLAQERLSLDMTLQYLQLVQLYNTLKDAGDTENIQTIERIMNLQAKKFWEDDDV